MTIETALEAFSKMGPEVRDKVTLRGNSLFVPVSKGMMTVFGAEDATSLTSSVREFAATHQLIFVGGEPEQLELRKP